MEIFGSTFDDSVFSEPRGRVCESLSSFTAKLCEPEWFYESTALDSEDSLEKQKVFKFRGDLALRRGNYQGALEAYSSCLQWIPDNNLSIRRDVLEGMARCCTKLGQKEKALDLTELLSKEASNTCHLASLLLLKVSIYQRFGAMRSEMSCLQQLCSLLPFNPWHWFSLGQMCLQQLDSHTSTESTGEPEEEQEEAAELREDQMWLKACICFIRTRGWTQWPHHHICPLVEASAPPLEGAAALNLQAVSTEEEEPTRLLLRVLQQQQSSFVLQRSEKALQTTDEALQHLNPTQATLQALTQVMSEDLVPEKMKEDFQDGESLLSVSLQSFRERWWNKVLLTGVFETRQLQETS